MRFFGVMFLVACASGRERAEAASPAAAEPRRCTFQERVSNVCAQLRSSVLLSAQREPLDLVLSECHLGTLGGELRWESRDGRSKSYRAVLLFDRPAHPRGPLRPAALHPLLLEWPCTSDCNIPVALAQLPVTEQCTSASLSAQPVELSVPAIDAFSCVGAALISHGKPDWCRRLPKRGDESYDIRGRRGYFAPSEQFHIDTFADRSSVEVNGQPATADQLELLRDQLAGLWQTPSVVDESCRDGGMMTIEARHAEGWKVIFRSCRHLIDRKALQPVANDKPDE